MVYRNQSDEDQFEEFPDSGSEPSTPGARPSAGPSPSRFPVPSLPRATPPTAPPPTWDDAPAQRPTVGIDTTRRPRPGGGRRWQTAIGAAAVLVMLALCGLAGAALAPEVTPEPLGAPTARPAVTGGPTTARQDLDSRTADPRPLTAREVFPARQLVVADGRLAYQVLGTHSSGSCAIAAAGELADLLARLGCNQVVRATLRAPDAAHLVTAGLFNLVDRTSAEQAQIRVRQLLDERTGRFRGMAAGEGTETLTRSPARVGWQVRGHYLAYCVVVRVDGAPVPPDDPTAGEILYDLVQLHLDDTVLERRALGVVPAQSTQDATVPSTGVVPSGAPAPSPTAGPSPTGLPGN